MFCRCFSFNLSFFLSLLDIRARCKRHPLTSSQDHTLCRFVIVFMENLLFAIVKFILSYSSCRSINACVSASLSHYCNHNEFDKYSLFQSRVFELRKIKHWKMQHFYLWTWKGCGRFKCILRMPVSMFAYWIFHPFSGMIFKFYDISTVIQNHTQNCWIQKWCVVN